MNATEIRLRGKTALRVNRGWGVAIGGWATWIGIDMLVNQVLRGVLEPVMFGLLASAASSGGPGQALLAMMACCCVGLAFFYYFYFAKVYGTTALAIATLRGGPRYRQVFSGFGCAWRTVGVHLWVGWRVFLVASPWLLPLFAFGVWCMLDPLRAAAALPLVGMSIAAHPLLSAVLLLLLLLPTAAYWYYYRLAYNVFVDHPDWKGRAVVDEARRLMQGRRGAMFRLDLWFIGLCFVVTFPGAAAAIWGLVRLLSGPEGAGLALDIARASDPQAVAGLLNGVDLGAIGLMLLGILLMGVAGIFNTLWIQPYWTAAHAAFYEAVLDLDEASAPAADGTDEADGTEDPAA